ncbi:hypothetical protein [Pseudomonas putida]|uniref:hypothetical protein n=1 Tax=Pseudomonas putida TaxID=303 RepID=UPI000B26E24D
MKGLVHGRAPVEDADEVMQQRLAHSRAQLLAVIAGMEDKPQGMDCEENAQRLIAGWQQG